ncbi:MAG TPA: hypothetical protein VI282_11970 [Verrucomicrobiae bacterium]|jgi:negative regulator of sigma E activity
MESNFRHNEGEEQKSLTSSEAKTSVEFATAEDAIRADVAKNPPPPEIAERLNESIAAEPKRTTSFWEKLGFKK